MISSALITTSVQLFTLIRTLFLLLQMASDFDSANGNDLPNIMTLTNPRSAVTTSSQVSFILFYLEKFIVIEQTFLANVLGFTTLIDRLSESFS